MKILLISFAFAPSVGGLEVNAKILADYFFKKGDSICVITSSPAPVSLVFPYRVFRKPTTNEIIKLYRWADIVLQNNPSLQLGWPGILYTSKTIIILNGIVFRNLQNLTIQDRIKQYLINRAKGVIAVSDAIRKVIFPGAVVIRNPYRDEVFQNYEMQRPALSFVFLGRLVDEKGVDVALRAFGILKCLQLLPEIPSFKIIGDGPERTNLLELSRAEGIDNQVSFLGHKEGGELVSILNSCKYILVPSRNEGFGNVVLEGMASGCLPIAAEVGGLPEAVGEAGSLFEAESPASLAKRIIELYEHPDIEDRLRENIPAHLAEHRSDVVARKYYSFISEKY